MSSAKKGRNPEENKRFGTGKQGPEKRVGGRFQREKIRAPGRRAEDVGVVRERDSVHTTAEENKKKK